MSKPYYCETAMLTEINAYHEELYENGYREGEADFKEGLE